MTQYHGGMATTEDGALHVYPVQGVPIILAQSAVAVSAGADTNENTLATITVPAGAMGANGQLMIYALFNYTNSGNGKTLRVRFSGASGTIFYSATQSTSVAFPILVNIANRNDAASQVGGATDAGSLSSSTTQPPTAAVDTTAATSIVITGQKASAGETLTLVKYQVTLAYGA